MKLGAQLDKLFIDFSGSRVACLASASEDILQGEAGQAGKTGPTQDAVQSGEGLFSKQGGVWAKMKDKQI